MSRNKTNSEEMGEVVDKIFSLNHNIVSQIITAYQDPEIRRYPKLNEHIEDISFRKLSVYFDELRDIIRYAIEMGDEMKRADLEGIYETEDIVEEIVEQSRTTIKDSIIRTIKNRIEAMYISMNFIPISVIRQGQNTEVINSIYHGSPEEVLRMLEYSMLRESIEKQTEIIDFEEYFSRKSEEGENFTQISPLISTTLIDSISDKAKFTLAEEQCTKFINESRQQEEVFDEFPELRDTTKQVEYFRMEERYKRKFEVATGYMNEKTTYSKAFFTLYKHGMLPMCTGFSKDEIDSRIKSHINEYAEINKKRIRTAFETSIQKHKSVRRQRNLRDFVDTLKLKTLRLGESAEKYIRKIRGGKVADKMNPFQSAKTKGDKTESGLNLSKTNIQKKVVRPEEDDGR